MWNTGRARIAYEDQEWIRPVNFGPEEVYLLGATALEIFDLMVDPHEQHLVRRPPPRAPSDSFSLLTKLLAY